MKAQRVLVVVVVVLALAYASIHIQGFGEVVSGVLGVVIALALIAVAAFVYFLPTFIGATRRVPNLGVVAVLNVLLGWTLIGWAVALAFAMVDVTPPAPSVRG
jgi:hypothetical protein